MSAAADRGQRGVKSREGRPSMAQAVVANRKGVLIPTGPRPVARSRGIERRPTEAWQSLSHARYHHHFDKASRGAKAHLPLKVQLSSLLGSHQNRQSSYRWSPHSTNTANPPECHPLFVLLAAAPMRRAAHTTGSPVSVSPVSPLSSLETSAALSERRKMY